MKAAAALLFAGTGSTLRGREAVQSVFFTTTFSLLAKMAKADGLVTPHEIEVIERFMRDLSCASEARLAAIAIFQRAKESNDSFDKIARRFSACLDREQKTIRARFDDSPVGRTGYELRLRMLETLVAVATSDGALTPNEEELLQRAREIFGIATWKFDELLGRPDRLGDDESGTTRVPRGALAKARATLEVDPQMSITDIKRRYRELLHENHPDKLVSQGLPPEFIKMAARRLQAIIEAFDLIEAHHRHDERHR